MRFLKVALAAGLQLSAAFAQDGEQHPLGVGPTSAKRQPNIILILTDDQDLHMNSLDYLPLIKKHLAEKGTSYKRHFCTTALCCPSRVSLWTGKQAHNTNVTDVNPPYGGYPKFLSQGLNTNYLPVWLQEAGYNTYYTGKLFNAHTVENYNTPHAGGWTSSDFLLDPYTYSYLNASYQRNQDPPVSYQGQHTTDIITQKAYGLLSEAINDPNSHPFFLGIAPVAPHSNVGAFTLTNPKDGLGDIPDDIEELVSFSPPIPAKRHQHLFKDVKVPRTANFNPDQPSGANWVRTLKKQTPENVDFNDHFYRQRLRALQGVDELVDGIFTLLDKHNLLENTYIFYTTDNGYHIGQHRLQPGKETGFEEDINIPLIVRGPGIPQNEISNLVTTHIDLAPTILKLANAPSRADFDGEAIPLTKSELQSATKTRHEHVTVEYWGFAASEGKLFDKGDARFYINNTYKALRIIGRDGEYSFYYSVWCNNEHELYDLTADPHQLTNLLHSSSTPPETLLNVPFTKVTARLDSLLFVLKSCKAQTCTRPWAALHPEGDVHNLHDALASQYDEFYLSQQKRVKYDRCEMGYLLNAEGPQFEKDGLIYKRQGARWDEWV